MAHPTLRRWLASPVLLASIGGAAVLGVVTFLSTRPLPTPPVDPLNFARVVSQDQAGEQGHDRSALVRLAPATHL